MKSPAQRVVIPGSERMAPAPAGPPSPPQQQLRVTVRVRPKTPLAAWIDAPEMTDQPPQARTYLSREELASQLGAAPADLARVTRFARAHGLTVVGKDAAARSVQLAGTAAKFSVAFGTALHEYESPEGPFRGRTGPLTVPASLAGIVEGVFGLDNRPQAVAHFQLRRPSGGVGAGGLTAAAGVGQSFTPPELARLYDFPAGLDGAGQCIGIIELGGGFKPADLKAYFQRLKLPVPKVKVVRIDGARNRPTTPDSADSEVLLDLEVAAAVAPGAQLVVYFAPNTSQGFLNAVTAAIHDQQNRPAIISISWGAAEPTWTGQAMDQFDQAFQAASLIGVTVCCAAGDNGSGDGAADGQPHVDFPASSPHVLACGGTTLVAAAGAGGGIARETVWNAGPASATGGGVSAHFPTPLYQQHLTLPGAGPQTAPPLAGRGVPDVAGNADPATGYEVRVDGQDSVIGGTSAVAPLWAGLLACLNQRLGKPVGFLNPLLYGSLAGRAGLRDITSGTNGAFAAAPGWDACTGWGSPNGSALLAALQALSTPAAS